MAERKSLQRNPRDRISELPAHIRQHILSFLYTRDALRSSILSTTWRYDWLNLPYLDFGESFFHKHWKCADLSSSWIEKRDSDSAKALEFLAFLNQALIRHRPTLQSLKLFLTASDELNSSIASCISGLTVSDVNLILHGPRLDGYHPPKCILNSISITKLILTGLNLISTNADAIRLPSLQNLFLGSVILDQKMVENLIANCPAIENMTFVFCTGFKSLKIVGLLKLKELMEHNSDLERIEIDAPNLYSLDYAPYSDTAPAKLILSPSCQSLTRLGLCYWMGAFDWVSLHRKQLLHLKELFVSGSSTNVLQHINLWATSLETLYLCANKDLGQVDITCCQNLVGIKLFGNLSDDWLIRHLNLHTQLRVLKLHCTTTPTHLDISSNTLEHLTIGNCQELKHIEIDCPKLSEFTYFIAKSITSLSSGAMLAPRCVDFHFSYGAGIESLSYLQLIGLFKNLRRSKYLSLQTYAMKNVIIPGELMQSTKSPLCQFKHLRLLLGQPLSLTIKDITRCVDSLLWLCPELKTIRITDIAVCTSTLKIKSEIYIKLEYKEPMELGLEGCGCYEDQINCWRHSLKDFDIIMHCAFEDDGSLRRFFESAIIAG